MPGFHHVELMRPLPHGPNPEDVVWLHVNPMLALVGVDIDFDRTPPQERWPGIAIQKVTAVRPRHTVRSWFDIGPPSCVEVVKMALGIRAFFVRTPWQLFKYIQKRNGVIGSGQDR
jgi:hypothetical protein